MLFSICCLTWSLTLREEHLREFENTVLDREGGSKQEKRQSCIIAAFIISTPRQLGGWV